MKGGKPHLPFPDVMRDHLGKGDIPFKGDHMKGDMKGKGDDGKGDKGLGKGKAPVYPAPHPSQLRADAPAFKPGTNGAPKKDRSDQSWNHHYTDAYRAKPPYGAWGGHGPPPQYGKDVYRA